MTPTELATKLAGADEASRVAKGFVRPFLRKNYTRQSEAKGTSWDVTADQAKAVTDAYKARTKAEA